MIVVGVDVGSLMTKVVVMDDAAILATAAAPTTGTTAARLPEFIDQTLAVAGVPATGVAYRVATGHGAGIVPDAAFVEDEVVCAGTAAGYFAPAARVLIHAGGQSIAAVRLDDEGGVVDFVRNDKCASGSGRFIEMIARKLDVPWDALDAVAGGAARPLTITAQCGVFAESEVIGHANHGETPADIMAGVCHSVAGILASQARRFRGETSFTVTGGVARLTTVVDFVRGRLAGDYVPCGFDPLFAAAIGAALLTEVD